MQPTAAQESTRTFWPQSIGNNIVVAAAGQDGIVCSPFSSTFPNFSHNDVALTGTGGQAWSSNCASFASTDGNISADPQFVNQATNDFHLQAGSPAIDAGDNTVPDLPQQDYDGNPRVAIGNANGLDTIDMGVYEFVLTGTPAATLSPASLSFGSQLVNTSSVAQTVTLSNTGNAALQINFIAASGDFSETNSCPAALNPGITCAIQVTFSPSAAGTRTGSLSIDSSAPPVPTVSLSGIGVQPAISVSPGIINFGDQPVNTDAPVQTITVTNPGTATLHVNSLSISGDPDFFTLTNNCVAGTGVAPGGSCSIQVEFAPKSAGPGSATLSIGSDAPNSPTAVALSGHGIDPIGSLSPSGLNFGSQAVNTSSAAQTVTLSNTGTDPLSISGISVSGDFTESNTCPATLAVGSSCTIQVTFHPTATGTRSGNLSVSSNSSPPVVSDFVTGTGVTPAKASVSPSALNFGSVLVGTQSTGQTITVTNTGGATLHISSLTVSNDPDFLMQTNNCIAAGVTPGGSCSIQVAFAPNSGGPGSGTLTISSDDPAAPQVNVSLSGTGVDYAVSASPASISTRSGHQAQTNITVSALGGSFTNSVGLSCSNLPTGANCSFSSPSVVPGATSASSSVTINTQQSGGIKTPLGTYSVTVLGTSNGLTRSTVITLTVTR